MSSRIEFARDGSALVTVTAGVLRIVELDGSVRATPAVAHRVLDAQWPGPRILAFDADASLASYDSQGVLVDTRSFPWGPDAEQQGIGLGRFPAVDASLSAGLSVAVTTQSQVLVFAVAGQQPYWSLDPTSLGLSPSVLSGLSVVLAYGAQVLAIGYEIAGSEPGRGWIVVALDDNRILDRALLTTPLAPGTPAFAFDRAGRRFAYSTPEAIRTAGAIRLDKHGTVARDRDGGARAVAFDPRGIVAAWAYRGRLRVDYLDPATPGPTSIAIADTLSIETALDPVAIAFSPDGRTIACLAADGSTEIVVVP